MIKRVLLYYLDQKRRSGPTLFRKKCMAAYIDGQSCFSTKTTITFSLDAGMNNFSPVNANCFVLYSTNTFSAKKYLRFLAIQQALNANVVVNDNCLL